MTDFFTPDIFQHAPAVKHAVKHVAHAAVNPAPIIQGFSMLSLMISNAVSLAIGGGLGWYIRGRGMTGVKNDIANAQNEIIKIKAQLTSQTNPAPAVVQG